MFTVTLAAPQAIMAHPIGRRGLHAAFGRSYAVDPSASHSMDPTMPFAPTPTQPVNPLSKVSSRELEQAGIDPREFDLDTLFGAARNKQRRKRVKLDHLNQDEKNLRRKVMNRVAAQAARDKKKAQQTDVERLVSKLAAENRVLRAENADLRQRRSQLESENANLRTRLGGNESSGVAGAGAASEACGPAECALGAGASGVLSGACAVSPAAGPRTALHSRAPRALVPLPAARAGVAPAAQPRRLGVAMGVGLVADGADLALDAASDRAPPVALADAVRAPSGKDAASGAHELRAAPPAVRARDAPQADALRLAPKYADPEASARDAAAAAEFGALAAVNVACAPSALPLTATSSPSRAQSQFLGIVLGPVAPASSPSPCVSALSTEQPVNVNVNLNLPDIVPDCESEPSEFKVEPDASSRLEKSASAEGAGAPLEDPALFLQILNDLLGDDGSTKSLLSAQVSPASLSPVDVDGDAHAGECAASLALSESCSGSAWNCADVESDSLQPPAKVQLLEQPLAFTADVPFSLANLDELDMFALDDLPAPLELI